MSLLSDICDPKLFGEPFSDKRKEFVHIHLYGKRAIKKIPSNLSINEIIEQNKEKLEGK